MEKLNITADAAPRLLKAPLRAYFGRPGDRERLALDDDNPLRILIADRDPAFHTLADDVLKIRRGLLFDYAYNGLGAVEKIIAFRPHVLLVSLDLPVISGIQICRQVKEYPETNSIRIIAITGCRAPAITKAIIDAGAEMCLQKPVDSSALLNLIRITSAHPKGCSQHLHPNIHSE